MAFTSIQSGTFDSIIDMTPREIDLDLAEIWTRIYKVWDQIAVVDKHIADYEKGLAKKAAGERGYSSWSQESLDRLKAQRDDLTNEGLLITAETVPYEDEYTRRGGWTRFWLVSNNGGHIHRSRHCSTCFPTTRFLWLPSESGKTEEDAVKAHGAILCTVCFPSAPVEWTNGKKPGDEDVCEGSGQYYDSTLPSRTGYYSGNWGTCKVCHTRQTVSKALKIRKHKKA